MRTHHDLTEPVIGLAILCTRNWDLGIPFRRQTAIPVAYRGIRLHRLKDRLRRLYRGKAAKPPNNNVFSAALRGPPPFSA